MSPIQHVLHRSARAIGPLEFADAVQAICRPRVPQPSYATNPKIHVALAVSGGVDSMALAYLCTQILRRGDSNPLIVADHAVSNFLPITVDHAYRPNSAEEARDVVQYLREHLGLFPVTGRINWNKKLGGRDQAAKLHEMSNFETVAREARYRLLARTMLHHRVKSLFLAHHEDDQYETVLMRLLGGHGPQGLTGMRAASDIPHTEPIHGAYQSGLRDDQTGTAPLYQTAPARRLGRKIQAKMRAEADLEQVDFHQESRIPWDEINSFGMVGMAAAEMDAFADSSRRQAPLLPPCPVEDGGLMMYRPLLEFPKDRIIATCIENGIPWFEDATNTDPTLTPRNTIRHLVKNHRLPVALQKPAILHLSLKCRRRQMWQEEEAARLFDTAEIHEFLPQVGSALIRVPEVLGPRARRKLSRYAFLNRQRRAEHLRTIAALVVQKMVGIVTPMRTVTPIRNLQEFVARLFPKLAGPKWKSAAQCPPKAFTLCGVLFTPVRRPATGNGEGDVELLWHLSRAPYQTTDTPRIAETLKLRWNRWVHDGEIRSRTGFRLFDGRFWIRLIKNGPEDAVVGPLVQTKIKSFRDRLGEKDRKRLTSMLQKYAPNTTRWTIPAIYAAWGVDEQGIPRPAELTAQEMGDFDQRRFKVFQVHYDARLLANLTDSDSLSLIALPTLDMYLPGAEKWIDCEVRYRKVDHAVLDNLERTKLRRSWASSMRKSGSDGSMWRPPRAATRRRRRLASQTIQEGPSDTHRESDMSSLGPAPSSMLQEAQYG